MEIVLQAIYNDDPLLEAHRDHLDYRWAQYNSMKRDIANAEGSLAEFARVRCNTCWGSQRSFLHNTITCYLDCFQPLETDFSPVQGYERFGINRKSGVTTFREWAPAAQVWLHLSRRSMHSFRWSNMIHMKSCYQYEMM